MTDNLIKDDLPCGDFGQSKLSSASLSLLSDFFDQLKKDHEINNGSTALWMHVVSIVSSAIKENE